MSTIQETIHQMGKQARAAAYKLAQLSSDEKNTILRAMAAAIRKATPELLVANAKDLEAGRAKGLSNAMLDRLMLDEKRIEAMAAGIDQVATLPDPVGEIMDAWERPNGIRISQTRVPIGTIGIIYESRPNVTADAAVLCFKTGNATILRGGSEAIHSNVAIAAALAEAGAPEHAIQLIPFTDRESVAVLAGMDKYLDLIIPRGGKGLIETVVSLARMPVIKHYDGICHLFADKEADLEMAVALTVNSKTQKPGVCNALEILLVHRDIAAEFLAANEASDVQIVRHNSVVSDYFDPARRRLFLRAENYDGKDLAASRDHVSTAYAKDDWAAGYDVVLHNECYGAIKDEALIQRIAKPHKEGGVPAVFLHCSMHSYRTAPNADLWREIVGTKSMYHEAGAILTVKPADAQHPVMRGFPAEFVTTEKDELYIVEKFWDTAHVLGQSYSEKLKVENPVIWVNENGKYRSFATTLGHPNSTMERPEYLDLVARGLLWACGKLDAEGKPLPGYEAPKR
jgi:gamma-glutamyl phosphate reductase